MRHIIFFCLLSQISNAQIKEKEFQVNIELPLINNPGKIYLTYSNPSNWENSEVLDSVTPTLAKIFFSGKIIEPSYAVVYRWVEIPNLSQKAKLILSLEERSTMDAIEFLLMPGETRIIAGKTIENSQISGDRALVDFKKLKALEKQFDKRKEGLMLKYFDCGEEDSCKTSYNREMKKLDLQIGEEIYMKFAIENPTSPLALFSLNKSIPSNVDDPDKYLTIISSLSKEINSWPSAIYMKEKLLASKNSKIGSQVNDFIQFDSLSTPITLSSFKGNYLFIDFWASWCIPCRQNHPYLKTVYEKYREENFTMLGVALEKEGDRERWTQAIRHDSLVWTQVTDFNFWRNSLAVYFGIREIPFNLLIDPYGIIIGKNLDKLELEKGLSRVFNR